MRILTAKVGLDGHDRGVKVISRALRDAGVEVIYTGLHQTPEQIVSAALQEDAQAIGMSVHSGAHLTLFPKVVQLLRDQGAEDIATLEAQGIAAIFTPGTPMRTITDWVADNVPERV